MRFVEEFSMKSMVTAKVCARSMAKSAITNKRNLDDVLEEAHKNEKAARIRMLKQIVEQQDLEDLKFQLSDLDTEPVV